MSPPRPLTAFKLLCAAASRFISHSVFRGRDCWRLTDMTETADAEAAPPAAPAAQTKAPKKKKVNARSNTGGPKLGDQIIKTVADCRDRKGMSVIAMKKALSAHGVDVKQLDKRIKMSIKMKLKSGALVQDSHAGLAGRFKVPKKEGTVKLAKKAKKSAATVSKQRKTVMKRSSPKKAVSKKSVSKKSTPKKFSAKKQGAKAAATKRTAPKKAAPKKPVARKAAPKKPAAKKASPKKPEAKKASVTKGKATKKVAQQKSKPRTAAKK
ncbi:histone H1-like [Narcine bancroftii]|uniref:histone H1-like n=1 Tax=Narcine bancroftii TaxID=1343680 RepID=UPI0038313B9A